MEREVGGGIGMGNTCKPLAVSFQCMTKSTTNKKKKTIIKQSYRQFGYNILFWLLKHKTSNMWQHAHEQPKLPVASAAHLGNG